MGQIYGEKDDRETCRILYTVSYPKLYFIFPKFHFAHGDSLSRIHLDRGKDKEAEISLAANSLRVCRCLGENSSRG